mmetsp:Transcript_745/g.2897  ORF Transcript_745/g.2897 Transcript_745/m.2897 type:complete len:219 (-) Transcript_745:798-1454(-)
MASNLDRGTRVQLAWEQMIRRCGRDGQVESRRVDARAWTNKKTSNGNASRRTRRDIVSSYHPPRVEGCGVWRRKGGAGRVQAVYESTPSSCDLAIPWLQRHGALHNDLRGKNVALDLLVRQNNCSVRVHLVLAVHVLTQHGHVLHPRPSSNDRIPSYNAPAHASVGLDVHATHDGAVFQTHPVVHHHVGTDGHVRSNDAILSNLGRLVDDHVSYNVWS